MQKLVSLGEILMRLTSENNLRFSQADKFEVVYGGSEANVLITAANFGLNTDLVTVLPDNDIGRTAVSDLKINEVGTGNILFEKGRLGLYFLEQGAVNRSSKVIYDRKNSAFSEINREWFNWEEILKDCDWFHWSGITPAISQNAADVCRDAIETAAAMGITISADLNYRANLWQYESDPPETMKEFVAKSDILLAGHYACQQFFDLRTKDGSNKELAERLKEKFPKLKKIAVTNRKEINASHHKWSASLFNGSDVLESDLYDIFPIVDRVGTGDSFMGALIYGFQNYDDQKALDFATAASSLKHTIPGDFNRVTKEEVLKLVEGDRSGRISR
ncbi:2-dehydro-3-deoxygluconokinase [Salinimicrobium marinum]|uniref:2-dehydro-3-deoxygluconokinase n=1 Tax=Salinimicrobium marinum TaxID=680283 RepID=A0A918SE15_9FLAO|nr:sugar kinase [Salinimicrobium marinum]GHA36740.1 2-dehydro-3-deoxygluconokinase [Salinimicrobium marinum]